MQLVHDFRDRKELRHCAKRLAAKVGVGAGDDHANATVGERRRERHNRRCEKLRFVDSDNLRVGTNLARDLLGRIDGNGLDGAAIVTRYVVDARITLVEMRFEDLHFVTGDDGPANTANQLLTLSTEHHAADYLDPPTGAAKVKVRYHSWSPDRGGRAERSLSRSSRPWPEPR